MQVKCQDFFSLFSIPATSQSKYFQKFSTLGHVGVHLIKKINLITTEKSRDKRWLDKQQRLKMHQRKYIFVTLEANTLSFF